MPESLVSPRVAELAAAIGFCGKLPARGDFVTSALPRRFVDPWYDWMQRMLTAGRERLGDAWLPAWMEAPVWRFALSPGLCGPDAALGLWMPSVDRVGRQFPLTIAALAAGDDFGALLRAGGGFLTAVEDAGREALARDLAPDELSARVAAAAISGRRDCGIGPGLFPDVGALWWSEGSGRVPGGTFVSESLPDDADFAAMLDAGAANAETRA